MSSPDYFGIVEGLFTTPNRDEFITVSRNELMFSLAGIPGDRHEGHTRLSGGREKKQYPKGTAIHNNRQWSALSAEELDTIADNMDLDSISPEWLGANILVSGIPELSHLPAMTLLKFKHDGDTGPVLVNYGQNKPCLHPHRAMEEALGEKLKIPFTSAAKETRGLVGWVEKAGMITVGDSIEIWLPA